MINKKQIGPYTCVDMIQSNSFWQIYNAIHNLTQQQYTIKQIPITRYQANPLLQEAIINEIECMKSINKHYPNSGIQRFETTLKSQNNLYLIYEKFYMGKQITLINKVNVGPIKPEQSIKYFNQILMSVHLIHQSGYIHGDIHQGTVKLVNYDSVILTGGYFYRQDTMNRILDVTQENNVNFQQYLAPELIKGEKVTQAVDIYQLGILLFWMLYGQLPFDAEQSNLRFHNNEQISNNIKQVIRGMLQPEPSQRLTFSQIQLILNNFKQQEEDQDTIQDRMNSSKIERERIRKDLGQIDFTQMPDSQNLGKAKSPEIQKVKSQNSSMQMFQQERNKYIFLLNISCAILDMNISANCLMSSLITTRLAYMIAQGLLKQVDLVQNSAMKYKYSLTSYKREINHIKNSFEIQISQLSKTLEFNHDQFRLDFNNQYAENTFILSVQEGQKLLQYVRELRQNLDTTNYSAQEQIRMNILIHLNNILDCIKLDEFFKEFMVESECVLSKQPYFIMIENLPQRELTSLIEYKIQNLTWL